MPRSTGSVAASPVLRPASELLGKIILLLAVFCLRLFRIVLLLALVLFVIADELVVLQRREVDLNAVFRRHTYWLGYLGQYIVYEGIHRLVRPRPVRPV